MGDSLARRSHRGDEIYANEQPVNHPSTFGVDNFNLLADN